ncbi:MAG: tetratricopeptide repeat protein [Litorimonas sp.]
MVDFISEVEEELRKDDYNKFLRRFGPLILAALVAVVLAVAWIEWRDYSADRTSRAAAFSYLEAADLLEDGRQDEARRAFLALADVAPDGYAGLSLMRAAIISSEQGNDAEAVRLYDAASARFDLERHSQLAALKAAYIIANTGAWSDVEQRATPLAEENAPYEFLARELLATALLNQGETERARAEYAYLDTVPGVPETVSRRAQQALVLMNNSPSAAAELPVATPDELDALPELSPEEPSETPEEDAGE